MSINFNNPIPDIVYINGNSYSPYDLGFPMDLEPQSETYSNSHTLTQNGNYIMLSDSDRYLTELDLSVNVPGGLNGQEKLIDIPSNTTTTISVTPDTGYNAITKLEVQILNIVKNKYDFIQINGERIDSTTYTNYLNPPSSTPVIISKYNINNGQLILDGIEYNGNFDGQTQPNRIYIPDYMGRINIDFFYGPSYTYKFNYASPIGQNKQIIMDHFILN